MSIRVPQGIGLPAILILLICSLSCESLIAQSFVRSGQFTDAEWQQVRNKYPGLTSAQIDQWRPFTHPRPMVEEVPAELGNQGLAALGYLDVTAAPFFADKTGTTDATAALQEAFNYARDYRLVAYLPAGTYTVSDTLTLRQHLFKKEDGSLNIGSTKFLCAVKGQTGPSGRAKIRLAPGSTGFGDPANPKRLIYFVNTSRPDPEKPTKVPGESSTVHYSAMWHSVDLDLGGNAGAVGLYMRSAEGSSIQDVSISAAGASTGVWSPPGSGGALVGIAVDGGEYGIEFREFPGRDDIGTQPSPNAFDLRLTNQTAYALAVQARGAVVIAGFEIKSNKTGPVIYLERHWHGEPFDSSLALVDGIIDYAAGNSSNKVIQQEADSPGRSFTLTDVFVRNAAALDTFGDAPSNPNGWRHFQFFAAHRQPDNWQSRTWRERIYLNGAPQSANVLSEHVDNTPPPSGLLARHQLPKPFPSIDSPGAILITDHGASITSDDNRAAIQAAINAAGPSGVVVVPRGSFYVRGTIHLLTNTRLVGIHPDFSEIVARDETSKRFGNNPDSTNNPLPIVATVDSASAAPIVGVLGISAPNTVRSHSKEDVGCYPLLWRSGQESVVNFINYHQTWQGYWRLESVYENSDGLGLGQALLPYTSPTGLVYQETSLVKGIIAEKFSGDVRLMTKSSRTSGSNLTFSLPENLPFNLTSLDLSNALFDDNPAFAITVRGHYPDGSHETVTLDFSGDGVPNPRNALSRLTANWSGVIKVEITAPQPFGIDRVVTNLGTDTFGEIAVPGDMSFWKGDKRLGYEHYPYASTVHPQILITGNGGGKWFSFYYHGDVWGQPEYRHVKILGTHQRLDIHHWHLQHIRSDAQAEMIGASRVSVYGTKMEHNNRFADFINCRDVRFFGAGGLASAVPGQAHFRYIDCEDFLHTNMAEEVQINAKDSMEGNPDNPIVLQDPSRYDGLEEYRSGTRIAPGNSERPIFYRRGTPDVSDPAPPAAPTEFAVQSVSATSASAAWLDNSDNETAFEIELTTTGGVVNSIVPIAQNQTSTVLTGLAPDTSYLARIRALGQVLSSSWSEGVAFATPPVPSADRAYLESGGMVVIEAENFARQNSGLDPAGLAWTADTAVAGSVGQSVATGTAQGINGSFTNGALLEYDVQFSTQGTYQIWVRRMSFSGNTDSAFFGFEGVENGLLAAGTPHSTWIWKKLNPVEVVPGNRVLSMIRREGGFRVDRILLTTEAAYNPQAVNGGLGPDESQQNSDLFSSWLENSGLPGDVDVTSDPTGNGVSLLLRYSFGLSASGIPLPLEEEGTVGLPAVKADGSQMTFTFMRRKDDPQLTYSVLGSSDLIQWNAITEPLSVVPIDPTWDRVTTIVPLSAGSPTFLILRVQRTPQ